MTVLGQPPGPGIALEAPIASPRWWIRPGLESHDGRLAIAGRDAEELARESGTPLFVYDLERLAENARAIVGALGRSGVHHRVRFALKANREPEVLATLRRLGPPGSPTSIGIDACSPGEVELALTHGWRPEEISFTGTNLSERDLDVLLPTGVHLNLDAISQVVRVGAARPRTADRAAAESRCRGGLSRRPHVQRRSSDEVRDLRRPAGRGGRGRRAGST